MKYKANAKRNRATRNLRESKLDEIGRISFRASWRWKHSREFDRIRESKRVLNGNREIDNFINVEKKKRNNEKFSNFFEEKGRKEILEINFIRLFVSSSSAFLLPPFPCHFPSLLCPLPWKQLARLGSLEQTAHSFRKLLPSFAHLSRRPLPPTFPQTALENRLRRSYTLSRCCIQWRTLRLETFLLAIS